MEKINIEGKFYTEAEAMDLGVNFHKEKKYQKAESIYRKIYRKNPRNANALHLGALILYHFGNFEAAIISIDRGININNLVPRFYYNKGIILLDMREQKKAKECFIRALRLNPKYAQAKIMINKISNNESL